LLWKVMVVDDVVFPVVFWLHGCLIITCLTLTAFSFSMSNLECTSHCISSHGCFLFETGLCMLV
jgi:hypothetical protein